jgi:hypothetical protein
MLERKIKNNSLLYIMLLATPRSENIKYDVESRDLNANINNENVKETIKNK